MWGHLKRRKKRHGPHKVETQTFAAQFFGLFRFLAEANAAASLWEFFHHLFTVSLHLFLPRAAGRIQHVIQP